MDSNGSSLSILLVYKKALAPGRQAVNLSGCLEEESGRIKKKPFKLARSGTGKREQPHRRERLQRKSKKTSNAGETQNVKKSML